MVLGILAGLRPCGVIVLLCELFTSESKSQVYAQLHEFLINHPSVSQKLGELLHRIYNCNFLPYLIHPEFVCYDDGCHLRRYAQNPERKNLTEATRRLADIQIVIDKMHMAGHVDEWCKTNCDPNTFAQLDKVREQFIEGIIYMLIHTKVDTEVCEQCFSWLSRYSVMTRRMKRSTFMFFLLYIYAFCTMNGS